MQIRFARPDDAPAIAAMLSALTAAGLRTRPSDEAFVRESYIGNPASLSCLIAEEAGEVLGLQVLSRAGSGNEWGITPGEGIIGTHVHPQAGRRGIARQLFAETLPAARAAALPGLVATIGAENAMGLGYYAAMGFETIEERGGRILKRLPLE